MKFSGSLTIAKPRDVVVRYFADPKYLGHYQDGFIKKDLLSGEEGQKGAVSKMYYKFGKRDLELEEMILANNLPESFESEYRHTHMDNFMRVRFVEIDAQTTRYEYEYEYTRISWFMPKLIALLFPGMYRKQGEKWMQQFKTFVEAQE